ncbi:hypothetical protein CHS0354_014382 [Potamilus streckersoni]|uniref:TIR domain-containing protein n=1 Tax=Potamilus streckersoni TaxID=2493646 RepID=A0AAE0TEU9_9BIVA|nr:hypothetical protein CHS0354_014382 [Potamilus streckersoni]
MESIVISAILVIGTPKVTQASCDYNIIHYSDYGYHFYKNNQLFPWIERIIEINDMNKTGCYINTTQIIEDMKLPEGPVLVVLEFDCMQMNSLDFSSFEKPTRRNAIGYFIISGCNISFNSINEITRTMEIWGIDLYSNDFSNYYEISPSECFWQTKTSTYYYQNLQYPTPNFTEIFSCAKYFPKMTEVMFKNISWTELPSFLQKQFINLQTLQIPHNNFAVPPYFPWSEKEEFLPWNLSRTGYFQYRYSDELHLDIATNVFKRHFNLDYNQITDLRNFSFHGYLHMLTIRANHLTQVGVETFRNVNGLRHLDISQNELENIPVGTFDGLSTLRYLQMQGNKLQQLEKGLFDDVRSLVYLNIANNTLSSLQKGLLSDLTSLSELHLENNNISVINTEVFPNVSMFLAAVYINNNPLLSLPEFIFLFPSLLHVDLRETQITFDNMNEILDGIKTYKIAEMVVKSSCSSDIDIKNRKKRRLVDLRNASVRQIMPILTPLRQFKLQLIMENYHFRLDENPLSCMCDIDSLLTIFSYILKSGFVDEDEYYFKELICDSPIELKGRKLLEVKKDELYCPISISGCPVNCFCFKRYINHNVIVDCRWRNLSDLHDFMPNGSLELWYNGNEIKTLNSKSYFEFVQLLNLSDNKVSKLEALAIKGLHNLLNLYLHSNLLANLPKEIAGIGFKNLTLRNNPFKCDCDTLWTKEWILRQNEYISDYIDTKCNDENEQGRQLVLVPDGEFVCKNESDYRDLIITAVGTTVGGVLTVFIFIIVFTYRLEIKVLLYIYIGVHPFDKDTNTEEEEVDVVIVHSEKLTDWVMDHLVVILEGRDYNFRVCNMARDFVVGFSFQENLNLVVHHSKRIIILISEDWKTDNEIFKVAWNIAKEKIKESKSNFGIIITHGVTQKQLTDKVLLRFMKRGRYIDSKKMLFLEKILYSMPIKDKGKRQARKPNIRSLIQKEFSIREDRIEDNRDQAFISYSDQDLNFLLMELLPKLEKLRYRLRLPDRDFIPGASQQDNILNAMDGAMRTVLVLSGSHIKDEWSLFTFRAAREKSLREKTNHLIIIVRDNVDLTLMDEDVKHYIRTYISLHANDRWFWPKLLNALPDPPPPATERLI